jgi:lipopolysaccharide cholinephosphotransferase
MRKEIDIAQLKELQLQVMDAIDKYCRQNGVHYYITAGTLIGALRHKGYIPWDDDIDIVMLRDDYEEFISLFNNSSERYKVYSIETDPDCHYAYAKVYDDNTVFIEGHERVGGKIIGVNVDVFPLDYVTDDYNDAVRLKKRIKPYDNIVTVKHIAKKDRGFLKNFSLFLLKAICSLVPYSWCIKRIDRIARKYEKNTESRYVVNAVIYAKGEREILEREWFSDSVELPFEGRKYLAPIGADKYMRRLFGDYMRLPPEDKRISHHSFKAYYK